MEFRNEFILNRLLWNDEAQKVLEYDQEIPQSHTIDQHMAPRGGFKER